MEHRRPRLCVRQSRTDAVQRFVEANPFACEDAPPVKHDARTATLDTQQFPPPSAQQIPKIYPMLKLAADRFAGAIIRLPPSSACVTRPRSVERGLRPTSNCALSTANC